MNPAAKPLTAALTLLLLVLVASPSLARDFDSDGLDDLVDVCPSIYDPGRRTPTPTVRATPATPVR